MSLVKRVVNEYQLRSFGAKGWMRSSLLPCPWCGRSDKFGVIIHENGQGSYNCFHGSCGEKGHIGKLWKELGREEFLVNDESVEIKKKLEVSIKEEESYELEVPEVKPPMGFKRIYNDSYLKKRGFTRKQFINFHVGTCVDPRFKKHLIFLIMENNKCVGFLGRTKLSKEWHRKNMQDAKLGLCRVLPRYQNAPGIDFSKIVGGYDDIVQSKTKKVIVVEGLMDKQNVDKQLNLHWEDDLKCIFTFGNSMSIEQILKIHKKGVEEIYLMYDYGTIKQSQQFGLQISKYMKCYVCELTDPDRDPGDLTEIELKYLLESATSPLNFKINKLPVTTLNG